MLTKNTFDLDSGDVLKNVHDEANCEGKTCVIHKPSPHIMRLWETAYGDGDMKGIMRVCPDHGEKHFDPDGWAWAYAHADMFASSKPGKKTPYDAMVEHGKKCCGCCSPEKNKKGDPTISVYALAYSFYNDTMPKPTPQEFFMTEDIRLAMRTLCRFVFKDSEVRAPSDFIEHVPYGKSGDLASLYGAQTSEFTMLNPVLIREGKVQGHETFSHYRSGFTASWPVDINDGEATMSQKLTVPEFVKKVAQPCASAWKIEKPISVPMHEPF